MLVLTIAVLLQCLRTGFPRDQYCNLIPRANVRMACIHCPLLAWLPLVPIIFFLPLVTSRFKERWRIVPSVYFGSCRQGLISLHGGYLRSHTLSLYLKGTTALKKMKETEHCTIL